MSAVPDLRGDSARFTCVHRALCAGVLLMVAWTPAPAENLLQVFELAVASDPEFLAARSENLAAQETLPQARAGVLPRIELSTDIAFNESDLRDDFRSHGLTLNIQQSVYDSEKRAVIAQAGSRVARADARYSTARQALMLRVGERYFAVLEADDALRFARATLEAFEQQLEQSRQKLEVGVVAITDVEEAKAGFDLARAQLIAAENALDTAHEEMRETSGKYGMALAPLGEMPLVIPEPADIDKWTEVALDRNLRILTARHEVEFARHTIERARSGHLPRIDAFGAYGLYDETSRGGETSNARVGLRLSVGLFTGGTVVSRTRESRHLYQKALEDLERARRQAQRETRDAYLRINSEISRITALRQAVRSSEAAADAIEAGFQFGTRTSVDVLDAKRDLFRARLDLERARYSYILHMLRLKSAAGILSEDDLRVISIWLG